MDNQRILVCSVAGAATGILPFIPGAGALFAAWVPYIPLLAVGLAFGGRSAAQASAFAIAVSMFMAGGGGALSLALFVVFPSCYMINGLTRYRVAASGRLEWYPVLRLLSELSAIAAALFMAFAVAVSAEHDNGLQGLLKSSLTFNIEDLDPAVADEMRKFTQEWSFLLLAFVGWFWVLSVWGLAVLVNSMLVMKYKSLRDDISITPFGIPYWLSGLLAISGLLAVVGTGHDQFAAKSVFLIVLLPYFLSGMARIHAMSRYWPSRRIWLFLIYVILIFIFWSAGLVAALGLYHHLAEMLDKRQKIR